MVRVLMVCLGNICRSPLAEGILKSKTVSKNIFVDSAGTGNYHVGGLPDERSIDIAREYNLDITDQRARQFTVADFYNFDYIYAMDGANYQNIVQLARTKEERQKVTMILNEVFVDENLDVPDPYRGGKHGFATVYVMLDQACGIIAEKITK